MKRHPSLAHLSREHHGALILARLLQDNAPAYKNLPGETEGKALYALKFYKEELVTHFKVEEKILNLVTGVNESLDILISSVYREHEELHELFKNISNHSHMAVHLDQLGKALEMHVRREEREVFPLIEQSCNEVMMIAIDKSLSSREN